MCLFFFHFILFFRKKTSLVAVLLRLCLFIPLPLFVTFETKGYLMCAITLLTLVQWSCVVCRAERMNAIFGPVSQCVLRLNAWTLYRRKDYMKCLLLLLLKQHAACNWTLLLLFRSGLYGNNFVHSLRAYTCNPLYLHV